MEKLNEKGKILYEEPIDKFRWRKYSDWPFFIGLFILNLILIYFVIIFPGEDLFATAIILFVVIILSLLIPIWLKYKDAFLSSRFIIYENGLIPPYYETFKDAYHKKDNFIYWSDVIGMRVLGERFLGYPKDKPFVSGVVITLKDKKEIVIWRTEAKEEGINKLIEIAKKLFEDRTQKGGNNHEPKPKF